MSLQVAEVECERCGHLVRTQIESESGRLRWLCALCVAERYSAWTAELMDEILTRESA